MAYFYRRSSGRFYARIRVPEALQPHFRTQELRRSLQTTDRALACRLALAAALEWKAKFARLSGDMDLKQLSAGSPLLLSDGYVSLADAAPQMGLSVPELFAELKSCQAGLSVHANGRMGAHVTELAYEEGGPAIDVGETLSGKSLSPIFGVLRVRSAAVRYTNGLVFQDCAFHHGTGVFAVFDLPGVEVPTGELLALRADCERVRQRLASAITPEMHDAARLPAPPPAIDVIEAIERASMGAAYKHRQKPCSELLEAYYAEKKPGWAPATLDEAMRFQSLFVELMGNPAIGEIDRDMMRKYKERLQVVPHNANRLRKEGARYSGLSLDELIDAAERDGLELINLRRADKFVAKIGEAFAWAMKHGYMRENPAANLAISIKVDRGRVRDQDKRQMFDAAMLARIFDQEWWIRGRGALTAAGTHYSFSPFKYWLPLMALYTGARRNELAQLYLADVRQTPAGVWYLDFNLDGDGKIDVDGSEKDKQLKTVNAQRVIALHPELVRLGLIDYVQALRAAKHVRLFPELSHDKLKGYGKYVGKWFNEEFMGKKLAVERDGKLSFHSFRHTFLTACARLNLDDRSRNEIAGHSRGEGVGHRYIKDKNADLQSLTIAMLRFEVPEIAPFDVMDGLKALDSALARKSQSSR